MELPFLQVLAVVFCEVEKRLLEQVIVLDFRQKGFYLADFKKLDDDRIMMEKMRLAIASESQF